MSNTIRTIKGSFKGERMKIRGFKSADAMHKFLNTDDNALHWRQTVNQLEINPNAWGACDETKLKPGTYAWAGGQWHNIKNLDALALMHI